MNQNVKATNANTTEDVLQEEKNLLSVKRELKNLLEEKGSLTWDDLLNFTRKRMGNGCVGYYAMTLLNLLLMKKEAELDFSGNPEPAPVLKPSRRGLGESE